MARESKRKRDERRFGKAERLADMLATCPPERWVVPDWLRDIDRDRERMLFGIFADVQSCLRGGAPVIDATNVSDYFWAHINRPLVSEDIPACRPPFPICFVEFSNRGSSNSFHRIIHSGFFCYAFPVASSPALPPRLPEPDIEICIRIVPFAKTAYGLPLFLGIVTDHFLGAGGDNCGKAHVHALAEPVEWDKSCDFIVQSSTIALLAFTFMNCKNVVTRAIEPDQAINRGRVRNGLQPFLRYHTINIEPMKRILSTEGQVETNGLRTALHIVRGHFATYSPERPLFGKHAGTFWVPAHVRGSLDRGAVISDYRVGAGEGAAS